MVLQDGAGEVGDDDVGGFDAQVREVGFEDVDRPGGGIAGDVLAGVLQRVRVVVDGDDGAAPSFPAASASTPDPVPMSSTCGRERQSLQERRHSRVVW